MAFGRKMFRRNETSGAPEVTLRVRVVLGSAAIALGIALGLIPLLISIGSYSRLRWTLVKAPVVLKPGRISVEFTPNLDAEYVACIRFHRTIPFDRMQCLLGETDYIKKDQCKEIPSILRFNWKLINGGQTIQEGSIPLKHQSAAYAADYIETWFTQFSGQTHQRYQLDVEFTSDATELAVTKPELRVEADPWEQSDRAMGILWPLLVSVVLIPVGLLVLFLHPARSADNQASE